MRDEILDGPSLVCFQGSIKDGWRVVRGIGYWEALGYQGERGRLVHSRVNIVMSGWIRGRSVTSHPLLKGLRSGSERRCARTTFGTVS